MGGIITLRESVRVPPVPRMEIPPEYKVPHPQNLVTRHPIYGRVGLEPNILKRKNYDVIGVKSESVNETETVPSKKKKRKKDKESEIVHEIDNNNVTDTKDENGSLEPAKKKKKKKKESEEAVEIKEEEDTNCDPNKS